MGFLDRIMDDWFGFDPPAPSAPPPAAPSLPSLPQIILQNPMPQMQAVMPTLGSGAAAGRAATKDALSRSGRASTILTNRKKKRATGAENTGFDTYAGTTLGT